MKRVKIRFATRDESSVIAEVIRRGQVVRLPDLTFIVPEPAIELLDEMNARYENLGEEAWEHVVRALRNPTSSKPTMTEASSSNTSSKKHGSTSLPASAP